MPSVYDPFGIFAVNLMIAGFASVAVVSEPNLFAFKYKALFVLPFRYPASSVPKPVRLS